MSNIPGPISAARLSELLSALDSGDEAGYLAGFEIGDEDSDDFRDTQLERGELRELLNAYALHTAGAPARPTDRGAQP